MWAYWRPSNTADVELGTVRGRDVGLPLHFHDEHQLTFVLAGTRRFFLGNRLVPVRAGTAAWLPAGVPHASAGEGDDLMCVNVYIPADEYDVEALRRRIGRAFRSGSHQVWAEDLVAEIEDHRLGPARRATPESVRVLCQHGSIAAAAEEMGMSREGFSRAFRAQHGMPPAAYRRIMQLNAARELLRAGEGIAGAAARAGFADQSHLGRWFQRVFGVTPGRYRRGHDQSQTF